MRHYAHFRLPYGTRTRIANGLCRLDAVRASSPVSHYDWHQTLWSDLGEDEDSARACHAALMARVSAAVGQVFRAEEFSFVIHRGSGEVQRHRDAMARTCFLIPLRCAPSLHFELEGYRPLALHGKSLVRFSDFEDHGLHNPHRSHFTLLTLSRDRV